MSPNRDSLETVNYYLMKCPTFVTQGQHFSNTLNSPNITEVDKQRLLAPPETNAKFTFNALAKYILDTGYINKFG